MRILLIFLWLINGSVVAETIVIRIAVAANFNATLQQVVANYETETGTKIEISVASSGVLYQQIVHGAPFDLFLSADTVRPAALYEQQLALGKPFTYVRGALAFWCPTCERLSLDTVASWRARVAMANPNTAPYGAAAAEVVRHLHWSSTIPPAVGNSVSQAYQFIATGNVAGGFVAYSQVIDQPSQAIKLPVEWYTPIVQQGVVLKRSQYPEQTNAFVNYLLSQGQREVLKMGYLATDVVL
ncbi:molybdate ABC transporter substrate-binding protein [Corallincola luteus]|uniref:Molybdate ABC transporter substrate-binding protein n=1 Tax=Corallincola luteus TaxID=1775177 RepID=A0ABY2AIF3_9GAMM|nr:molybdate ABC transporter substrate-binding protein [Corallincola luteus]TCI02454.1 molybdate ABC transporter substrate-binding protein [Corallincola luteus]